MELHPLFPSPFLFLRPYLFVGEEPPALQGLDYVRGTQDAAGLDVGLRYVHVEGVEGDEDAVVQHQRAGTVALRGVGREEKEMGRVRTWGEKRTRLTRTLPDHDPAGN